MISASIVRNLSDELRHNIVMHKPEKLEATKMSNTNKMRVELLTVGETEDEKWVGHLKRRIKLGHLKFEAPVGHSLSDGQKWKPDVEEMQDQRERSGTQPRRSQQATEITFSDSSEGHGGKV